MSTPSNIYTDKTLLSRIDQLFYKFESFLTLLGGVVILALVLLATTNVLGRWIFDKPISGYVDWVEQAMAFFAFLGLSYTQRIGGHIRMDIFISRLRGRTLWFAELLSVTLMLVVTLILTYGSYLHFLRAYKIGDSSMDIDLPTWPAKLIVPIALSVFALRLILQIWAYLRAIKNNSQHPVAVPLIEDAAALAAAEDAATGVKS